jgi:hypothetical protein
MKKKPKGRYKYMKRAPAPDKRDVKDLYYLDELIKDMYTERMITWGSKHMTFLHDWYFELKAKVNHTDEDRLKYLTHSFGEEMLDQFLTEEERDLFLNHNL